MRSISAYFATREATTGSVDRNPFDTPLARQKSTYAGYVDYRLLALNESNKESPPLLNFVHDAFRSLVLNPQFSCVGAKSAIQKGGYRIAHYEALASSETSKTLAYDLFHFLQEQPRLDSEFSTFIATFSQPIIQSEEHFESLLWQQLQQLSDLDTRFHEWDIRTSDDPNNPEFSFSFAEGSFFIVGLHPAASRFTRRFAWPTLVFNVHAQFEQLRGSDRFGRMQEVIRAREKRLQDSLNQNLADYGTKSEARQYSGRPVEDHWQCPFVHRK